MDASPFGRAVMLVAGQATFLQNKVAGGGVYRFDSVRPSVRPPARPPFAVSAL